MILEQILMLTIFLDLRIVWLWLYIKFNLREEYLRNKKLDIIYKQAGAELSQTQKKIG